MKTQTSTAPVYGIETEYSCMVTPQNGVVSEIVGSCHSVDSALGLYVEPKSKGTDGLNWQDFSVALESMGISITESGMLSNGGRFYIDPSGPEYATPETSTAEEAALRTFDGDEIMLRIFKDLLKKERIEGYQINRRVVDHNRSSRGIHLNTSTSMGANLNSDARLALATVNVAKGAIFGSGGLLLDEDGNTHFHHSPRLSITSDIAANYSQYKKRPLVRVPFKNDGVLHRVETVTADALNFAWPIKASLVVTNLMTRLIEEGYELDLPRLRDPVAAAHVVGRHGNRNQIAIESGEEYVGVKPLDILRSVVEKALTESDVGHLELDQESLQVLAEVIEVSDKVADDPMSVVDQVESSARLYAMQSKMENNRLEITSERMCRFDYAWDWLGGGIAESLRKKGLAGWQGFKDGPSVKRTEKRLANPPHDTRAKLRGEAIRQGSSSNQSDWSSVDFNDLDGVGVVVHPLDTSRIT